MINKNNQKSHGIPSDAACDDNAMEVKEAILRNAIEQAEPVRAPGENTDINQSEQSAYRDPAMGEIES